jgi:transposase
LAADKTLDRDGNGAVNVLRRAVLGQAHAGEGLADADDGFEVADLITKNTH